MLDTPFIDFWFSQSSHCRPLLCSEEHHSKFYGTINTLKGDNLFFNALIALPSSWEASRSPLLCKNDTQNQVLQSPPLKHVHCKIIAGSVFRCPLLRAEDTTTTLLVAHHFWGSRFLSNWILDFVPVGFVLRWLVYSQCFLTFVFVHLVVLRSSFVEVSMRLGNLEFGPSLLAFVNLWANLADVL